MDIVQSTCSNMYILLAGDFNYPGIVWTTNELFSNCTSKSEYSKCLEMASYFLRSQIVTTPTRGYAVLDLVLTTHPEQTSVIDIDKISDHCVVHCTFSLLLGKCDFLGKQIFD